MKVHNANVFQPFSQGPRNCIGKAFGLAEVRIMLATLLWEFDIEGMSDDWTWEDQNAWFVWEKNDLLLKIRPNLRR